MEEEEISAEGRRSGLGGVLVTEPGRIIITLSTPAFAAAVLVFVLFFVLSFAAGHWQGGRVASADKAVNKEPKTAVAVVERSVPPLPAPAQKKGRETGIWRREVAQAPGNAPRPVREPMTTPRVTPSPVAPAPGPPEPTVRTPYYALQVIAGINPNKAEKLRTELEQEGYQNVVVKQEGKGATVFLGRFDSKEASEAKQYLKVIKEKKFEGKPQFKDCYIVKVE